MYSQVRMHADFGFKLLETNINRKINDFCDKLCDRLIIVINIKYIKMHLLIKNERRPTSSTSPSAPLCYLIVFQL